jgi:glycosyltransferase involved in cell wall biosynthesis
MAELSFKLQRSDVTSASEKRSLDERMILASLLDATSENSALKHSLALETRERERVQTALREVFDSSSWKITAPLRRLAMAAHAVAARAKGRQIGATEQPDSADGEYGRNTRARARYFTAYANDPSKQKRHQVVRLLASHPNRRGVVLCPVTYDLSLKQRSDHIMAEFAKAGYLCVMLEFGGAYPVIKPRSRNLYISNMVEEFLLFYQDKPVTLYLHFPGFKYVAEICRCAFTIYDVLDDLTIFANYSEVMRLDHEVLLETANICLFSSKNLLEANKAKVVNPLLFENGACPDDFRNGDRAQCEVPEKLHELVRTRKVVGYHGVISELIDFDLLDELVRLDNMVLLFVGSVMAFEPQYKVVVQERMAHLRTFENFIHLGGKPYSELKHYLAWVDVGIVPFIVSEKTDSVSPLKLFEYLAAEKPVVATPTRTISEYAGAVTVASGLEFVERLASEDWVNAYRDASAEVARAHTWPVLHAPLLERVNARNLSQTLPASARGPTNVDIVNVRFYDWKGETVYKGGAERYVYDLAMLVRSMGCNVRLLQSAWEPFEHGFHGVKVIGVKAANNCDFGAMSSKYAEVCADSDLIIASPTELATSLGKLKRVISINHGIHWDPVWTSLANFDRSRYEVLFRALRNSDRCVCVDTNFINWLRTYDWALANTLTYVPNYVDMDLFKPYQKDFNEDELCVLLPRRLYEARGLYLTINAFDLLFERRIDLSLILCGQAHEPGDAEAIKAFMARHPNKVTWVEYGMEDMHKAYVESHIVLVPTMCSEGTSLSCIEALATNNAVIATNVGGLPNLIVDGYNGRLIRADYAELASAIEELADDRVKLAKFAANGLSFADAFSKAKWEKRWREVIETTAEA